MDNERGKKTRKKRRKIRFFIIIIIKKWKDLKSVIYFNNLLIHTRYTQIFIILNIINFLC